MMNEMSFWRVTAKASWACERWWMFRALQVVHNVRNTEHEEENSKKWDRAESRERSGYKQLYLPCKHVWILCWDPWWATEGFLSRRIVWSTNNFAFRISQSLLALGRSREKQIKRQRKSWEAIIRWSCRWSRSQSEGAKKKMGEQERFWIIQLVGSDSRSGLEELRMNGGSKLRKIRDVGRVFPHMLSFNKIS